MLCIYHFICVCIIFMSRLANTIEHLECKVEEAHRKLEDAKDAERFGKHKMEKRRTASLASLNHDIDDNK